MRAEESSAAEPPHRAAQAMVSSADRARPADVTRLPPHVVSGYLPAPRRGTDTGRGLGPLSGGQGRIEHRCHLAGGRSSTATRAQPRLGTLASPYDRPTMGCCTSSTRPFQRLGGRSNGPHPGRGHGDREPTASADGGSLRPRRGRPEEVGGRASRTAGGSRFGHGVLAPMSSAVHHVDFTSLSCHCRKDCNSHFPSFRLLRIPALLDGYQEWVRVPQ